MKFLDALLATKNDNKNIVIPDIKCFSPKEGDLMHGRNPVDYAKLLQSAGAPVVSVVTEEKEFHGSLQMLRDIADAIDVPILRKDFIHTREELIETKEAGASAILLMCSCLEKDELVYLYEQALDIGLDPFVETHVAEDFELVNMLGAKLVGINNRDILVLERDDGDVSNTLSLASLAPKDAFLVTESSIKNPSEVRAAIAAGADAALVGTAILIAEHTKAFYQMMCRKISLKVCGLMNIEDVELCVKLGVERIGCVADYPLSVPWNLTIAKAKELRAHIPAGYKACIVVGGTKEKILSIAKEVRPDMMQLHYKESMEDTREIATLVKEDGISIIKSIPASSESCIDMFGTDSIEDIIMQIADSDVAEILIDPRHGNQVASNNLKLDVELAKKVLALSKTPVCIAGGINIDNLSAILDITSCDSIDVMNGSEDAPGAKNEEKILGLIKILDEQRVG